jgi:hypothetical protein
MTRLGPELLRHRLLRPAVEWTKGTAHLPNCSRRPTPRRSRRGAYGVYVLADRTVWAPRWDSDEVTGLASPPADAGGFVGFGDALIRSQRIAVLLGR